MFKLIQPYGVIKTVFGLWRFWSCFGLYRTVNIVTSSHGLEPRTGFRVFKPFMMAAEG